MDDTWVRGRFEGTYRGVPSSDGLAATPTARAYALTLVEGRVSRVEPVAGMPPLGDHRKIPFKQERLKDVLFEPANDAEPLRRCGLVDITIIDWDIRHSVENANEVHGTLTGTLYARVADDPLPPPPKPREKPDDDDRKPLDLSGILPWAVFALVFAWLWWTCGPVTAVTWAVVVLGSHLAWSRRLRADGPPSHGRAFAHGLLGLPLVAFAGLGAATIFDSAFADCDPFHALPLLWALLGVVGASFLAPRWPLVTAWLLWTLAVAAWCGRTGGYCTDGLMQWASGGGAGEGMAAGGAGGGAGQGAGGGEGGGEREGEGPDGVRRQGGGEGDGTEEADDLAEGRADAISLEEAMNDPDRFYGDKAERVVLSSDLLFEFNEARLRPRAEPKLRQVARLLRLHHDRRIVLEGHADTIGDERYNQHLSEQRAHAVRSWLVDKAHINPNQVLVVGYGSSQPVVSGSLPRERQRPNRRVEVRVLGADEEPPRNVSRPSGATRRR